MAYRLSKFVTYDARPSGNRIYGLRLRDTTWVREKQFHTTTPLKATLKVTDDDV